MPLTIFISAPKARSWASNALDVVIPSHHRHTHLPSPLGLCPHRSFLSLLLASCQLSRARLSSCFLEIWGAKKLTCSICVKRQASQSGGSCYLIRRSPNIRDFSPGVVSVPQGESSHLSRTCLCLGSFRSQTPDTFKLLVSCRAEQDSCVVCEMGDGRSLWRSLPTHMPACSQVLGASNTWAFQSSWLL